MPLVQTALALLHAARSSPDETARTVHSLLLNTLIRHAPGPLNVSRAAQAEARRWGFRDLRDYHWNQQIRVMGDTGRKTFAWDHFYPVAELRRQIEALKPPTEAEVRRILGLTSVAWILKTEDRLLNKLGFRQRRPDPYAAYAKAKIRLLGVKA